MILHIRTEPYNPKDYGQPWIARLELDVDDRTLLYLWGKWIGTPGDSGKLVLDISPGQYYAVGQKGRHGRKSRSSYYRLGDDGTPTKDDRGNIVRYTYAAVYQALITERMHNSKEDV